jgi:hypothetical protein
MKKIIAAILFSGITSISHALDTTGPFVGTVNHLQVTDFETPYNTVILNVAVASACIKTNGNNGRFTVSSELHQTTVLAAFLAGKEVKIYGNGQCVGDLEAIHRVDII